MNKTTLDYEYTKTNTSLDISYVQSQVNRVLSRRGKYLKDTLIAFIVLFLPLFLLPTRTINVPIRILTWSILILVSLFGLIYQSVSLLRLIDINKDLTELEQDIINMKLESKR